MYKFIIDSLTECGIREEIISKVNTQFWSTNYRFESLIDQIHKTCDRNMDVTKLFDSQTFNHIHGFLAQMLMKGSSIITTNFDTCIENVLFTNEGSFDFDNYFVYGGEDLVKVPEKKQGCFIKIHGSQTSKVNSVMELVTTIRALAKTSKAFSSLPNWRQFLIDIIKDKIIVVLGYSCSDDFDVVPLLKLTNPSDIFWFNFDNHNEYPIQSHEIKNKNIYDLSQTLPLKFYNGRLIPSLKEWSHQQNIRFITGDKTKPFTIKDYIDHTYPDFINKMIYCNEILLNFSVYDHLYVNQNNPTILLQNIKAQFRLGDYDKTIIECKSLLHATKDDFFKLELLYYLSSALYYKQEYYEAVNVARKCLDLSKEYKDNFTYLNMFINYNSILYAYLWREGDLVKLQDVIHNYTEILTMAKGINLEAEANAWWGLGDVFRCTGDMKKAREYFEKSHALLMQIGNIYAVEQLEKLMN